MAQSFEREQLHFGQPSSYFVQLPQYIQRCRDHMIQSLQSVGLRPVIPQGSYFLITDISDFSKWARPGGARAGTLEAGCPGLSTSSVPQKTRCLTCLEQQMSPTTNALSSG